MWHEGSVVAKTATREFILEHRTLITSYEGEVGNGRATAVLLARHGAKVALLDNNLEWVQETKRMIDAEGGIAEAIQTDVTDEGSCKRAVAKTIELFGAVHILVNIGKGSSPLSIPTISLPIMRIQRFFATRDNMLTRSRRNVVGVGGVVGDATKLDLQGWDRDFRINVTSMVLMSRFAIPEMRKAGRGAIVNLSSVSGMLGGNPSLLYATSKGAIIQMTRAMAVHHGKEGIRVNCVAPGMVYTPMVRSRGGGMSPEMRQARIEQNLLGVEGTAWDVGYGKVYLFNFTGILADNSVRSDPIPL